MSGPQIFFLAPEALFRVRVDLTRRPLDVFEEALLIREVHQGHGVGIEAIADRFGKSQTWVRQRLDLVTVLPDDVQQRVLKGRIPVHSALKVLVVMARSNPGEAQKFAAAIDKARLSTRDIERLHRHYRQGTARLRREVIENPLRVLETERVHEEINRPVDELEPRERDLVNGIESLERRLDVLAAQLREITFGGAPPALVDHLETAWKRSQEAFGRLTLNLQQAQHIENGGAHDRREKPEGDARAAEGGTGDPRHCPRPSDSAEYGASDCDIPLRLPHTIASIQADSSWPLPRTSTTPSSTSPPRTSSTTSRLSRKTAG